MGLEKHVDNVLVDAGIKRDKWYWSDGLNADIEDALDIMNAIDDSDEFGPVRYNPKIGKVEFAARKEYYVGKKPYKQYVGEFMSHKDAKKSSGRKHRSHICLAIHDYGFTL